MPTRTLALKPGSSVPRWLRRTAWAAFIVTIPSAVWRALMICGLMPGTDDLRVFELGDDPVVDYVYVFALSIVQLGASFLTIGLVRPWGRVFLGHRVARTPVVVAATLGGLVVTWLFSISMVTQVLTGHRPDAGHVHGAALAVMLACYIPIVLWGPLELLTTYGYWRQRAATSTVSQLRAQGRQVVSGG